MTTRFKNAIDAPEAKAYEEILDVLYKHKDHTVYDIDSMERAARHHLFGVELKEKYGLNIDPQSVNSLDWYRFSDYAAIGWWGEKYKRRISWSDDNRQPEDELLLQISFSTGAYIFGDDYPVELFNTFFAELASYKPDYCDSHNHNIYWKIENAKTIFNEFGSIFGKFIDLNKEEAAKRRILRLKKELESLESAS